MSKLHILVTTMHQTDFSKYPQMNLQTDAVIANQTDKNDYCEAQIKGNTAKLISTDTRGTSRNRNIAMAHMSQQAEYIMFSDDDLVFNEGYEQLILQEFEKHPEAEAIKFNIHNLSLSRKISMRPIQRFEKATRRNMSSSGVCGLALKTEVIKKNNLHFHEDFGPGCEKYCGEDTIFLMQLIEKKVRFYRSPIDIAGVDLTESTWFQGHNERYFITQGRVLHEVFPLASYLLVIRSTYRAWKRKDSGMGFFRILACYYKGLHG